MLYVNGQIFLETVSNLWVRLIGECDLYAKIYGKSLQVELKFVVRVEFFKY